jgi:serine/threonine protein kinase
MAHEARVEEVPEAMDRRASGAAAWRGAFELVEGDGYSNNPHDVELVIGDFGISVLAESATGFAGTRSHISRRQIYNGTDPRIPPEYDQRVDLWALGLTVFSLFTGFHLWQLLFPLLDQGDGHSRKDGFPPLSAERASGDITASAATKSSGFWREEVFKNDVNFFVSKDCCTRVGEELHKMHELHRFGAGRVFASQSDGRARWDAVFDRIFQLVDGLSSRRPLGLVPEAREFLKNFLADALDEENSYVTADLLLEQHGAQLRLLIDGGEVRM